MKYVYDYEKKGIKGKINDFVLLSASPRRKEFLKFLNPKIESVDIDERTIEEKFMKIFQEDDFVTRAAKVCCEISKAKSEFNLSEGSLYISADTIVVSEEKIFNKPVDLNEAREMLLSYLGKSHYVVTSVCLRMIDYVEVFYTLAKIEFSPYYSELESIIENYINDKRPLDKAGGYGFQELDPRLVKYVEGDINTIIGLPVSEVAYRIFGES